MSDEESVKAQCGAHYIKDGTAYTVQSDCRCSQIEAEVEVESLRTENTAQAQRIAGLEAESKRLREALLNAQATVLACLEDDARDCSAADHAQGLCNCNALGTILLLRPSPQVQSNPVHVHGAGSECDMDCVEEAARANALSSTPDPQAAPSEVGPSDYARVFAPEKPQATAGKECLSESCQGCKSPGCHCGYKCETVGCEKPEQGKEKA